MIYASTCNHKINSKDGLEIDMNLRLFCIDLEMNFEYFKNNLILDGSHNPKGIKLLVKNLKKINANNWQIIFGSLKSKNPDILLNYLKHISSLIVTVKIPNQENSFSADELFQKAKKTGVNCKSASSLKKALSIVSNNNLPTCICGSLYLAGYFLKVNGNNLD